LDRGRSPPHADRRPLGHLEHVYDGGLVRSPAVSHLSLGANDPGKLVDRASGICTASAGEPFWLRSVYGRAAQDYPRSYFRRGIRGLQLLLSARVADLANRIGISADRRRSRARGPAIDE